MARWGSSPWWISVSTCQEPLSTDTTKDAASQEMEIVGIMSIALCRHKKARLQQRGIVRA
jgi:hypothetical protein